MIDSGMSLHAGQETTLLQGQTIIAKVTLERAHLLKYFTISQIVSKKGSIRKFILLL